jgi:hypothetical protein
MGNSCLNHIPITRKKTFLSCTSKLERANPIREKVSKDIFDYQNIGFVKNDLEISEFDLELFDSDNSNKKSENRKSSNEIKSKSFFKKIFLEEKRINEVKDIEKNLKVKLIELLKSENYPNSRLIHSDDLMIPFPEDNDLGEIKSYKYIYECIEEIKKVTNGKFIINGFHVFTATIEKIIKYMSLNEYNDNDKDNDNYNDNENNYDESFYLEDDKYIGINFKLINNNTYAFYYLSADSVN